MFAVGVEGGVAYCACSRCERRWDLLSLQKMHREVWPALLAFSVREVGQACCCAW